MWGPPLRSEAPYPPYVFTFSNSSSSTTAVCLDNVLIKFIFEHGTFSSRNDPRVGTRTCIIYHTSSPNTSNSRRKNNSKQVSPIWRLLSQSLNNQLQLLERTAELVSGSLNAVLSTVLPKSTRSTSPSPEMNILLSQRDFQAESEPCKQTLRKKIA